VKSRDERAWLIAVTRKVEGVKAVKTDLVVKPQQKPGVEARAQHRVTPRGAERRGFGQ